jgi:hypothetical protein
MTSAVMIRCQWQCQAEHRYNHQNTPNAELKFDMHRKKLLAKAAGSLEALRGISGSTWGASLMSIRKLYQAVIVPQAL